MQGTTLAASYFDGQTAKAQAVLLRMVDGDLVIVGDGVQRSVNAADVQWPERTRHGVRVAHFTNGGSVQCSDAQAWDLWRQQSGQRDSWVVRAQQSWRGVLASVLLLVLLAAVGYQWGLPWAARAVVAVTPHSVDASLGQASLLAIDERLMQPSKLPLDEQALVNSQQRCLAQQGVNAVRRDGHHRARCPRQAPLVSHCCKQHQQQHTGQHAAPALLRPNHPRITLAALLAP